MDAAPARRKALLIRAFACESRPTSAAFFLSSLFSIAAFEVYPHTSFVTIRRMIEAHAPPTWAARLTDTGKDVELFLMQVDGAKCRLDDTQLSGNDTLTQLGLGGVDVVHVLCSIAQQPPVTSMSADNIGRCGRLHLRSPSGSSNDAARQSNTTITAGPSGGAPSELIYVRVLGSIIPKLVRVVLHVSPSTFFDGLFPQLEAKLMQLDAAPPCTLSSSTYAFFLFTVLGVGCGKPGRRLEPLERVGHVADAGSNVLTVCIRACAHRQPLVSSCVPLSPSRPPDSGDNRRCFVASTTWDTEECADRIDALHGKAPSTLDDGRETCSSKEEASLPQCEPPFPPSATVHVELDLPRVEADSDDDCDPTGAALRRFPEMSVEPGAINMLEDAFELADRSDSDDVDGDLYHLDLDCGPVAHSTPWNALPLSFLTCIGSDRPSTFVAEHSPTLVDAGDPSPIPVSTFLETLRRSQFEDELLLAFDLTEELDAAAYTVYAPHQPEITSAQLQAIMHVLAVEDEGGCPSPPCDANSAQDALDRSALHGEWDLDDVETICAHDGQTCAVRHQPNALPISPPLPSVEYAPLSPAAQLAPMAEHAHPAASGWPAFCGPQPPTPPILHEPLLVGLVADRVTHSDRQHAFFRQQALVPLMEEHRRLHNIRVESQSHLQQQHQQAQSRHGPLPDHAPWSRNHGTGAPLCRSVSPLRSNSVHQLPPIASSPQHAVTRRSDQRGCAQGHSRRTAGRMNVVASIYVPPERQAAVAEVFAERRHPRRLDDMRHQHPSVTMSSVSRGSTMRSQAPMALPLRHPMLPSTSSGEGGDVFAFLSQTLRSMHDDPPNAMMSASMMAEANNAHLDLLRSSAVATYTQRLLQEHRDIAQRANELARMLQASPPTSLLGGSYRMSDV